VFGWILSWRCAREVTDDSSLAIMSGVCRLPRARTQTRRHEITLVALCASPMIGSLHAHHFLKKSYPILAKRLRAPIDLPGTLRRKEHGVEPGRHKSSLGMSRYLEYFAARNARHGIRHNATKRPNLCFRCPDNATRAAVNDPSNFDLTASGRLARGSIPSPTVTRFLRLCVLTDHSDVNTAHADHHDWME
jgi:hypothetical protein